MLLSAYLLLLVSFGSSFFSVCAVYADEQAQSQINCSVPVAHEGRPVNFTVNLPATLNQDDNYHFSVRFNKVVVPVGSCDVGRTKDAKSDSPCTVDEGYAISGIRHPQVVFTVLNPKKKDAGNFTFTLKFYGQGHHPFTATCGLEVHAGKISSDSSGQTTQTKTDTTADPGKPDDDSTRCVAIAVPVAVLATIALVLLVLVCLWKSQRFQEFLQRRRRQQIHVPDAENGDGPASLPTSRIDGDGSVDKETIHTPLQKHQPIQDPKQENGGAQSMKLISLTGRNGSSGNASTLSSRRTADGESLGGEDEDDDEDYQKTASQPGAQALLASNKRQGDTKDDDCEGFEILEFMEQEGKCGDHEMETRAVSGGWCRMQ